MSTLQYADWLVSSQVSGDADSSPLTRTEHDPEAVKSVEKGVSGLGLLQGILIVLHR
jgi:hypothetical protein